MVNPLEGKCVHYKFYKKLPDYAKHLRTFVEMGVVRIIVYVKSKIDGKGMACMFLGYAENHTFGT